MTVYMLIAHNSGNNNNNTRFI